MDGVREPVGDGAQLVVLRLAPGQAVARHKGVSLAARPRHAASVGLEARPVLLVERPAVRGTEYIRLRFHNHAHRFSELRVPAQAPCSLVAMRRIAFMSQAAYDLRWLRAPNAFVTA